MYVVYRVYIHSTAPTTERRGVSEQRTTAAVPYLANAIIVNWFGNQLIRIPAKHATSTNDRKRQPIARVTNKNKSLTHLRVPHDLVKQLAHFLQVYLLFHVQVKYRNVRRFTQKRTDRDRLG